MPRVDLVYRGLEISSGAKRIHLPALLEEALPAPSCILSFSPLSTEKAVMEIKFKVASAIWSARIRASSSPYASDMFSLSGWPTLTAQKSRARMGA
jgi:hypothetical protein